MSAFVVNRTHIDALVLAGVQFGLLTDAAPKALASLGTTLWAENRQSVDHTHPMVSDVRLYWAPARTGTVLDAVAVVRAVDGYVYQSREHPGWADSMAAAYCAQLRGAALAAAPVEAQRRAAARGGRLHGLFAYDNAPWSVRDVADVTTEAAARRRRR